MRMRDEAMPRGSASSQNENLLSHGVTHGDEKRDLGPVVFILMVLCRGTEVAGR